MKMHFPHVATTWFLVTMGILGAITLDARTFRNAEGKEIEGRVIAIQEDQVAIELSTGKRVIVPIATFSREDQTYLERCRTNPPPLQVFLNVQQKEGPGKKISSLQGRPPGPPPIITGPPRGFQQSTELQHYEVELTNPTDRPFGALRIEYRLYVEKGGGGLQPIRGVEETEPLAAKSSVRFKTDTAMVVSQSSSKLSFDPLTGQVKEKGKNRQKDTLGGIWIRAYHEGEMVKEVKRLSPDLARKVTNF